MNSWHDDEVDVITYSHSSESSKRQKAFDDREAWTLRSVIESMTEKHEWKVWPLTILIVPSSNFFMDFYRLLGKYCNFRQLNDSHTQAVRCTVPGLLQKRRFRIRLDQGPLGKDKTITLAALLPIVSCFQTEQPLVCAPTKSIYIQITWGPLVNFLISHLLIRFG